MHLIVFLLFPESKFKPIALFTPDLTLDRKSRQLFYHQLKTLFNISNRMTRVRQGKDFRLDAC